MEQDTETQAGRAASALRYERLRTTHPHAFRGAGPIRIDDREPSATEGVVHANPWFLLVADPVILPDGRRGTYSRVIHAAVGTPVAVLPMTAEGGIVLLRHWRHATQSWHFEIPRGFGEDGVAAADQAATELREELGVEAELTAIGTLHPDTGLQNAEVALFVARIAPGQTPRHREGLGEVVEMDDATFRAAVLDGRVTDPFAIAAWTRAVLLG